MASSDSIHMKCCANPSVSDWSYLEAGPYPYERVQHLFCHHCRGHMYKGEFYNADAWHRMNNPPAPDSPKGDW